MNVEVDRVLDAPVSAVWKAWTESDRVHEWWGPEGWTAPVAQIDARVGGTSLVSMRSPEGHEIYNTWTYTSVDPESRLEFVSRFADASGKRLSPADIGLPPAIPDEVPHVVTLTPLADNRTRLTVTESGYASEDIVAMSKAGMEQCIDKMAATF